jgi:hypothetical protein
LFTLLSLFFSVTLPLLVLLLLDLLRPDFVEEEGLLGLLDPSPPLSLLVPPLLLLLVGLTGTCDFEEAVAEEELDEEEAAAAMDDEEDEEAEADSKEEDEEAGEVLALDVSLLTNSEAWLRLLMLVPMMLEKKVLLSVYPTASPS